MFFVQICSKRTVRQKKEFAIFVNFVNFGCHNNYFRPGPRLLYPAFSFNTLFFVDVTLSDVLKLQAYCIYNNNFVLYTNTLNNNYDFQSFIIFLRKQSGTC